MIQISRNINMEHDVIQDDTNQLYLWKEKSSCTYDRAKDGFIATDNIGIIAMILTYHTA